MTLENPFCVSESALRIIGERAPCWPGDLLSQVVMDEVEAAKHHFSSPSVTSRPRIDISEIPRWIFTERLGSLLRIYTDWNNWAVTDFGRFFSRTKKGCQEEDAAIRLTIPRDAPAEDVPQIVTIARKVSALYRQAIEWSHTVRNADVDPVFREATYEILVFCRFISTDGGAFRAVAPRRYSC